MMQCHDVRQEQIVLSLCVCMRLISQVPLFHREHAWRECLQTSQVSLLYLKNQVLLANVCLRSLVNGGFSLLHKNTFCVLRFPRSITDWIGFGLGWFGNINTRCFSKRLLNELSNWLLFNCRTRLIIPFGPIVIVFQWDLWWWSRRQVWSFMQNFSSLQSFNFWNAISWKCSLKDDCIRSCLIECYHGGENDYQK